MSIYWRSATADCAPQTPPTPRRPFRERARNTRRATGRRDWLVVGPSFDIVGADRTSYFGVIHSTTRCTGNIVTRPGKTVLPNPTGIAKRSLKQEQIFEHLRGRYHFRKDSVCFGGTKEYNLIDAVLTQLALPAPATLVSGLIADAP